MHGTQPEGLCPHHAPGYRHDAGDLAAVIGPADGVVLPEMRRRCRTSINYPCISMRFEAAAGIEPDPPGS